MSTTQQSNATLLRSEAGRLQSFENWPIPHIVTPESLARSGFYYLKQDDKTKCVFCRGIVERWEIGDDPDTEHIRHFPYCQYVQQVIQPRLHRLGVVTPNLGPNVSFDKYDQEELRINLHRGPHRTDYVTFESRLESFASWPKALLQTPKMLADAGFYYLGNGDAVQCFSCGGGFKDWEPTDDPWTEHAKWFSKCNFVLLVKGHDFVKKSKNTGSETASKNMDSPSGSKSTNNKKLEIPSKQELSTRASTSTNPTPSPESLLPTEEVKNLLKKSRLCKICMSAEIGVVFLPCGHLAVCVNCAPSLKDCPICRSSIKGTVRTFMS